MNRFPEQKPNRYDALVILVVLALALLCAARFWLAPTDGAAEVVVRADGAEIDRLPLADAERTYQNNGYTLRIAVTAESVRVTQADCPTQDCVHTGRISRQGQSIVCLPARIVITVEGTGAAPYDAIAG